MGKIVCRIFGERAEILAFAEEVKRSFECWLSGPFENRRPTDLYPYRAYLNVAIPEMRINDEKAST